MTVLCSPEYTLLASPEKVTFRIFSRKPEISLSSSGKLMQGKKSDLVGCLEAMKESTVTNIPSVEVKVLDGAAVVPVGESKSFAEYAKDVFF